MSYIYLARQPIYDCQLNVYAYELLYRADAGANAPADLGEQATYTVLKNALTEIGLDELVGPNYAFVNLTRGFLTGDDVLPFSRDKIVVEVLEDIDVDDAVIAGVKQLSEQGYIIALDDFVYDESLVDLIRLSNIIKIDVLALGQEAVRQQVELLKPFNIKLLAEKVESQEEFEYCKALGFDYFQGYFFCKPKVLKRQSLPASQLSVMQLLSKFQDPDLSIEQLCDLISRDASLSYRLLRYVNSAMFGLSKKVDSIRHAVVVLGFRAVQQLVRVLAMSEVNDKPHELLVTALLRAKMCELLAEQRGNPNKESFFIVGLFSVLDALLDIPMEELLASLSMADEINAALLSHTGVAGEALECVLAYEQGRWDDPVIEGFDPEQLHKAYFEAVSWSGTAVAEIDAI